MRLGSSNLLVLIGFLSVFSACVTVTPHQNFIDAMNSIVGENVDELKPYEFGALHKIKDKKVLKNGNLEYYYHAKSPHNECRYVLEIDSSSHRILNWRFDGDSKGCILPP